MQAAQMQAAQMQAAQLQAAQLQYGQAAQLQAAYGQGAMYQQYAAASGQYAGQYDPVDVFIQELGILPEEDGHFGWIAEYGLQSEVMPPRWTMQTDPSTGRAYYVDGDL